ncbi:MAG: hypothetical protein CBC13_05520 [Planctomycetia bacterium TMED53]|nr:MAG: hypothetical protein CBC13_05520 [Planctomycetia bacterium TMED53]
MRSNSKPLLESFSDLELKPILAQAIARAGYEAPRPIQAQAISPALEGRDILGLAQTGTGKTAAFAIPSIESLLRKRGKSPRVLVIAPTRELVSQIDDEFKKLTRGARLKSMTIYGGVSEKPQIEKLRKHPDIICACPGRLLDLMQQGHVDLSFIRKLVLDEADHMFDMGFLPDIRRILKELPEDRQNLLFAATMPKEIRKLAQQILRDPFVAEIDHSAPAKTIEHALYPVPEKRKIELLRKLLKESSFASAIVFTRTKRRARQLAEKLGKDGHKAVALQGNMSQNQRDRAMTGFRKGQFNILVATDIAARGIDVESVSHVINLDIPNTAEAYTHRIGRTGRSEREGKAMTFVSSADIDMVMEIEKIIGKKIETIRTPGFEAPDFERPKPGHRKPQSRRPQPRKEGSRNSTGRRKKPRSSSESSSPSRRRRNTSSRTKNNAEGSSSPSQRRRSNSGRNSSSQKRSSRSRHSAS